MHQGEPRANKPDERMKVLSLQDLPDDGLVAGGAGDDDGHAFSQVCEPHTGCTLSADCNGVASP